MYAIISFYKSNPKGIDQIRKNWDLYNLPNLSLDDIAHGLVKQKHIVRVTSDLEAQFSLANPLWRIPVTTKARAFVDEACVKLGTPANFMEEQGLVWSADIIPNSNDQLNSIVPADDYLDGVKCLLKENPLVEELSVIAQQMPSGNRIGRIAPYAAVSMAALAVVGHDIYQYADGIMNAVNIAVSNVIDLPFTIPGCIALFSSRFLSRRYRPGNTTGISVLEQISTPLMVNHWIDTAKEFGGWKASMQDKFFDVPNLKYRSWRDCALKFYDRRALKFVQKEYNWQFKFIPDLEAAPQEEKKKVTEHLTRETDDMDDGVRGVVLNITSADPQLQGTRLRLAALPPAEIVIEIDNPSGPNDGNRKEAKPDRGGIGKVRDWVTGNGGWSPLPA